MSRYYCHKSLVGTKILEKISYRKECKLNLANETSLIIISWAYLLKYKVEELIDWGGLCLEDIGNTKKFFLKEPKFTFFVSPWESFRLYF